MELKQDVGQLFIIEKKISKIPILILVLTHRHCFAECFPEPIFAVVGILIFRIMLNFSS